MAQGFIQVDTPGLAASNLTRFTYHHRPRPMFPFERDATYAGATTRRRRPAMRFAILGISPRDQHLLAASPPTTRQFEASGHPARRRRSSPSTRDAHFHVAGYLQAADELGFEAVPLMFAQTGPDRRRSPRTPTTG